MEYKVKLHRFLCAAFLLFIKFKTIQNVQFCDLYVLPAVGIQKPGTPACFFQIVQNAPAAPVQVDVPVADSAAVHINKAGELPVMKHHVWQAVIAVEQNLSGQQIGILLPERRWNMGIACFVSVGIGAAGSIRLVELP